MAEKMTTQRNARAGRILFPAILWLGIKLAIATDTYWADLPWIARFCVAVVGSVFITVGVIGTSRAYRE